MVFEKKFSADAKPYYARRNESLLFGCEQVANLDDGSTGDDDGRVDGRRILRACVGNDCHSDCLQATYDARDECEHFLCHSSE